MLVTITHGKKVYKTEVSATAHGRTKVAAVKKRLHWTDLRVKIVIAEEGRHWTLTAVGPGAPSNPVAEARFGEAIPGPPK